MKQYLLQMPVSKAYHHDAWMALIGFGLGEVAYCKEPLIQYRMHEDNESLSNFTKSPRWLKALVHLAKMPFLSSYLNNEIELASAFKTLYEKQIPASKLEAINNLISLKGKIYFQKKWGFEKAFKNQWIKRF
jgi:hypothetical protein